MVPPINPTLFFDFKALIVSLPQFPLSILILKLMSEDVINPKNLELEKISREARLFTSIYGRSYNHYQSVLTSTHRHQSVLLGIN